MDPSRNCRVWITTFFFIFLSLNLLLPPSTGGGGKYKMDQELRKKLVLGSKPPTCVNKCMRCRPCQATLVIPPHMKMMMMANPTRGNHVISSHREDGSYYLLSWKCRCGNKLYQP